MAHAVIHHFPGGTKEQYEASVGAVHPGPGTLPKGQLYHFAGPTADGWVVVAVHDSKASWEKFRDEILRPAMQKGIAGGFAGPPHETEFAIHTHHRDAHDDVRKASRKFYEALSGMCEGHAGTMADVWTHGDRATAFHPIGSNAFGSNDILKSFDEVAKMSSGGHVHIKDQHIHVVGDLAYEVGQEEGEGTFNGRTMKFSQRVTNIYERENGEWKMVHHHSDPSTNLVEGMKV